MPQIDRKALILDSAESLARSRGYDGFSYADLEAEVGIRKASIHHHFPSKAELARALVRRYCDRFYDALDQIDQKEWTAGGRLAGLLDIYEDALDAGSKLCLCISFSACSTNLPADVLDEIKSFRKATIDWLKKTFMQGANDLTILRVGNMSDEATACLALIEGAQLISRAEKSTAPFSTSTKILRERLV